MAQFDDIKRVLHQKRTAEQQGARTKERERSITEQIAQLRRSANPNNPDVREEIGRLQEKVKRANTERAHAQSELASSKAMLDALWREILPLTDPRRRISAWSDDHPILLFPLRLETRFKKVTGQDGAVQDELWVRVYPDDCLIDTFEEDLTDMERKNARRYWASHWSAAGDDTKERQAWAELVAAHGSGRAGWIRQKYVPLNPTDAPPVPSAPGDYYLVIPAQETEPVGADADAVADFWKRVLLKQVSALHADERQKKYPPANLKDVLPSGARVKVVFARFPAFGEEDSRPFSWSEAPKVKLLPERFVFLGYNMVNDQLSLVKTDITRFPVQAPLAVGPNPSASKEEQFKETNDGDLEVPEDMRWMTDFEEALAKGMGFRIPLEPSLARSGFTRVLVLGIRLGSDMKEGQVELEELLRHHLFGRSGFSIVPQGTPTNNTEDGPSGYSRTDDPEESFPVFVKQRKLFDPTPDPLLKTDGQWLAEWLGLDMELLRQTPNADQTDQAEAKAMNRALWPATMGYWMQKMMSPVFKNGRAIPNTRRFFTQYVSGRGHIPAVRVGRQPYGILQASAYSRAQWVRPRPGSTSASGSDAYVLDLYGIVMRLDRSWKAMAKAVQHVGNGSTQSQQQLLDIVGLYPSSVEYHARDGHDRSFLYNYLLFMGVPQSAWGNLLQGFVFAAAKQLLADFGYVGQEEPKIFEKYYRDGQHRLNGPIVDDRPLSETDPIRGYAENGKNYLGWLIEAVGDYDGKLLPQIGFAQRPTALLYLLLRHALMEEYDNAGHRARFDASLISELGFQTALAVEPNFIHVQAANTASESRFAHLLEPVPSVTGNQEPLVTYLGLEVKKPGPALAAVRDMREMEQALALLEAKPTARLERLLAEHIDCCTYRHDAWVQGLLNVQLERMRSGAEGGTRQGLYLGAYAWLENLKPEGKTLTPVTLAPDQAKIFQRPDDSPLTKDSTNQGYIHAPSLNHAVTAAVLRNGYLSNATPTQPGLLAVNLSSDRVRKALEVLEGIRNGQSLGALLGYRFERTLHDHNPAMFVFSYQLRKAFPLVANKLKLTRTGAGESQEAIAARNVVDGYALLKKALGTNNTPNFSFLAPLLVDPAPTTVQRSVIEETILDLLDIHDALSDLGLSESVHQIVQGNYDRASASLDAFSKATFPQVPDVAITPRSGSTLTHRVALHLNSQAVAGSSPTPRCKAEPALNEWLAGVLPLGKEIAVLVTYANPGNPSPPVVTETVTMQDLGLQPLDLLYLFHVDTDKALGALDERILRYMFTKPEVHAHAVVRIKYTDPISDPAVKATLFEVTPLLRSLRTLITTSRPLHPNDAAPPSEAVRDVESPLALDRNRIATVLPNLVELDTLVASWTPLPPVDQQIAEFAKAFAAFSLYGLTESGFGFVYDWRQSMYTTLVKKIAVRVEKWEARRAEFTMLLANDYPAAATDDQKTDVLRRAEALVSTEFIAPLPGTIAAFEAAVLQKRAVFDNKVAALDAIVKHPPATLGSCIAAVKGELPLTPFDAEAFTVDDVESDVARFQQDLIDKTMALRLALEMRVNEAKKKLAMHDAATTEPGKRTEALQAAGKILFGEDFMMIPQFRLPESQGFEWQNALDAVDGVLAFQKIAKQDAFPVDTWLYGAARVREKLHHLENTWLLSEAFGKTPSTLLPTQFPFRRWVPDPVGAPGVEVPEPWLALEFPSTFTLNEEKVLYTASYTKNFDRTLPQCGLLLDEWTEVIPLKEETTGLTFHFDRPNSEPPQAWLLVTPATSQGQWVWEDVVGALHETLDLAKQRAVEPAHVEETPLGVFSPATVFPVTPWAVNPSLNLNLVNIKAQLSP